MEKLKENRGKTSCTKNFGLLTYLSFMYYSIKGIEPLFFIEPSHF